jgi:tRNA-modifying protein YgfZ
MKPTPPTHDVDLLARDAVLLVGEGRELIIATGADRVRFLNGIVTGNVGGTPVGGGCHAALLTPKGHVVSEMWIFRREEQIWIAVEAGQAEPVAAALGRYAIMDDFAAAPRRDFAFLSLLGPAAPARLAEAGFDVADVDRVAAGPQLGHADIRGLWMVRVHRLGTGGFWVGGPPAAVSEAQARLEAVGVTPLAPAAAEAARIAAREPRFGAEITSDYFPMEVGLDDAIEYGKGCYLGQEPIVRVRDRGRTNWRLAGLEIVGGDDPRPGDLLESDAKPKAGRVTSVGRFADGRGVALAMVHVSVPAGATVRIKPAAPEAASSEAAVEPTAGGAASIEARVSDRP